MKQLLIWHTKGWINCIGVFQDYYQTHELSQYSSSTIAWIPALEASVSIPFHENLHPYTRSFLAATVKSYDRCLEILEHSFD
jgi:hypothetical protein